MLFALLGAAREIANPELERLIGFPLDGEMRRKLNDEKYVESQRPGRAFVHELAEKGWRWCADELAETTAGRASGLERAHAVVFSALARYLDVSRLSLADVFGPEHAAPEQTAPEQTAPEETEPAPVTNVAARVEDGYRALAPARGQFIGLRALRLHLADLPRPQLDAALAAMFATQRINLIPQSSQQALTAADRESALRLGGEFKHLISIE